MSRIYKIKFKKKVDREILRSHMELDYLQEDKEDIYTIVAIGKKKMVVRTNDNFKKKDLENYIKKECSKSVFTIKRKKKGSTTHDLLVDNDCPFSVPAPDCPDDELPFT